LEFSPGSLPESLQGVLQESRRIVGEHLLRTELISAIEFGRVAALTETGVCQTSPMGKAHYIDSSDPATPRAWCLSHLAIQAKLVVTLWNGREQSGKWIGGSKIQYRAMKCSETSLVEPLCRGLQQKPYSPRPTSLYTKTMKAHGFHLNQELTWVSFFNSIIFTPN
jgi:hypothetical protein